MTNRERLFNVLEGKPVDRVPVWLLFPYHKTNYYTDVRTNHTYRGIVKAALHDSVMLDRRTLTAPLFSPEVRETREEFEEDGWRIKRHSLHYNDIRLFSEIRRRGPGETSVRKMLNNDEDLSAFCSLPVETDPKRIAESLERQLPAFFSEKREFPAECGATMLDLGEPVNPLYHASNLMEYPVWSVTHSGEIKVLLDSFMKRLRIIYDFCLKRDLADVYFLVGSELAAPPMVGLDTFREWIVPYAKELIGMIRGADKKSIQHFHGFIKRLLPDFLEMAPDGLHTIEAPPVGDCTLAEAFEATGNRITLIGNIQYEDLRAFPPDRMRQEVLGALSQGRGKRFMLSPSAGPFLETLPASMERNYRIMIETAVQEGIGA